MPPESQSASRRGEVRKSGPREAVRDSGPYSFAKALLLVAIVALGLWLRLAHLEHNSFFVDEYFHVFAGEQLLISGEPRMPDGGKYTRALPYTYLVAGSFALFGVSEWSARLPSALAGTLLVLVAFGVGRHWFGVRAGLVAAALVAAGPPVVDTARLCRMYSSFQVLYLGVVFAYERGWEPRDLAARNRFAWRLAFPVLLYGSYRMHMLTADFAAAIGVYWLVMLIAARDWRYAALLAATALATLSAAAVGAVDLKEIWTTATLVPGWAAPRQDDSAYYVSVWGQAYPWMWFAAPTAALFACARYRRTGFYLVCQLAVPLALHSFVFGWKELRYVSHLFPLLALVLAPALVAAADAVIDTLRIVNERLRSRPAIVRFGVMALIVEVAAMTLILGALPSISIALGLQRHSYIPDWRGAFGFIAGKARPGDVVLSAVPYSATYYLPRLGVRLRENGDEPPGGTGANIERWLIADMNAGWQRSLPDLQRKLELHRRGWLVIEPAWLDNPGIVEPRVRDFIESHLQKQTVAFVPPVLVFHWEAQ